MADLFFLPFRPVFDSNAKMIPGAQAYFTLEGTNTPTPIYEDEALSVPLSNPVVANALGRFPAIYMDDLVSYRVRLYDADAVAGVDSPIEDYDPYSPTDGVTINGLQDRGIIHVRDFDAVGDDVADDTASIQAAIDFAGSIGGGDVLLDAVTYRITDALDIKYPRVRLVGTGTETLHDSGTPTNRTVLNAAFAGTSLKIRTPYAAEQGVVAALTYRYSGAGCVGVVFDGGGVGTKAVEVDSVAFVEVDVYATGYVGTTVFEVKTGVTGTDLGEACDVQHSRLSFRARQIDTAGEKSSNILTLTGSSNANVSLNRGPHCGISVSAQHWDGHVIVGNSADNNDLYVGGYRPGGAGKLIHAKGPTASVPVGFEDNTILFLTGQGATTAEGTGDPGVVAAIHNRIECRDTANGTPAPTAGTGSSWTDTTSKGVAIDGAHAQATFAETEANADAQRALVGSESVRVHNASSNHIVLTDGTNVWGINVNGGNLRLLRVAGTGFVEISPVIKITASGLADAANDAAAAGAGVAVNQVYRNGSVLMVRVA